MPASLTYIGSAFNTSDLSSYTFAGQSIGVAASDRDVVVVAHHRSNLDSQFLGCTIGGVAATEVARVARVEGANRQGVSIYAARVTTGTTADVVLTLGPDITRRCVTQVYRLTGVTTGVGSTFLGAATDDRAAGTLTAASGSVVIAGGIMGGTGGARPATWGPAGGEVVTEDDDQSPDAQMQATSASALLAAPLSSAAIDVTFSGAGFATGMPSLALAVFPELPAPPPADPYRQQLFHTPAALPRPVTPFPRSVVAA